MAALLVLISLLTNNLQILLDKIVYVSLSSNLLFFNRTFISKLTAFIQIILQKVFSFQMKVVNFIKLLLNLLQIWNA